jgi:hypothetical protein
VHPETCEQRHECRVQRVGDERRDDETEQYVGRKRRERELREQRVAGGEVRIPERRSECAPVRRDRVQPRDVVVEDVVGVLHRQLAVAEHLEDRERDQGQGHVHERRPSADHRSSPRRPDRPALPIDHRVIFSHEARRRSPSCAAPPLRGRQARIGPMLDHLAVALRLTMAMPGRPRHTSERTANR